MQLFDNERCDSVNDDLRLIQKTDGLTFGTDALLLAAYINSIKKTGIELGGGTGIITFLLISRDKLSSATVYEIQEEYASLIERNTALNRFESRIETVCKDIRELSSVESADIVYTNPPYMKNDSGKSNLIEKKNIARHEVFGGIDDFCIAAKKLLKYGGSFYAVYRPDRLCDIVCAMREHGIEPKRMTFVQADISSIPSSVLIEGKRGGKSGIKLAVIIGSEGGFSKEEAESIVEKGAKCVNLGPRILRCETAPDFVLTAISYRFEL